VPDQGLLRFSPRMNTGGWAGGPLLASTLKVPHI
jgi:hypothetical protein